RSLCWRTQIDPIPVIANQGNYALSGLSMSIADALANFNSLSPTQQNAIVVGSAVITNGGNGYAAGTFPLTSVNGVTGTYTAANGVVQSVNITSSIGGITAPPTFTFPPQTNGNVNTIGTIATGASPEGLTVHPNGKFFYVANTGANTVTAYSINQATGALTIIGAPIAAGSSPTSIAVSPNGLFAYITNTLSGNVFCYSINQVSGALTYSSTFGTGGSAPTGIAITPSGLFAYVTNNGSNTVTMVGLNTITGVGTVISSVATGTSPSGVTVAPSGSYLYVANFGSANISMFSINPLTGALTSLGLIASGNSPASIAIPSNGLFAYVANYASNNVTAYAVNQTTGILTLIGTYASGTTPNNLAISNDGLYLYVACIGTNNFYAYAINQTTGVLGSPVITATGSIPNGVAVSPTLPFFYVTNTGGGTISEYTLATGDAGARAVGVLASNIKLGRPIKLYDIILTTLSADPTVAPDVRMLYPKTPQALDTINPSWRYPQSTLTSNLAVVNTKWYTQDSADTILLAGVPSLGGTLNIMASLVPLQSDTCIDASLAERHWDTIIHGAKARLMAIQGKPWTDPNLALFHRTEFDKGVSLATMTAANAFQSDAPIRTTGYSK
ncbi:MAG: beta-propeller fold lactonase family protein, partial [Gallionella sp.]